MGSGQTATTANIGVGSNPNTIENAIYNACPNLKDKLIAWDGSKYGYYGDGREVYIRFRGYNADPDQITLVDSTDQPLTGPPSYKYY